MKKARQRRRPRKQSSRRRSVSSPLAVAKAFINRINTQDVDGLCALMTPNHRFIDPTGAVHIGREPMRAGWRQYFTMFPDYRIKVTATFIDGNRIAAFGTTRATYAPNGTIVEMHAAWLAVIRGDRIAEWRVCADNEPARAAMRK